jgi:vitamin B12 transporter
MKHPILLAALGLPLSTAALAATDAADRGTTLDPVVVTATRTPTRAEDTLASVSVVDRAEIDRRQLRSVPDALRGLPGVTVSTGAGISSVFLRGTDADSVLVLVDGVKVGSATLGTTPWADLPIDQIERIEVVRGPRSSLYGSKALGGVIQIFTRHGGGELKPRFTLGAGSYSTASISGGLSGGGQNGWFDIGANFEQSDGYNACYGRVDPFAGCGVVEPDKDGYRQIGGSLRAGYRFSDRAEVDLSYLGANNRVDFDGSIFSGNYSVSDQQVLGAKVRLVPLDPWTATLSAGRSLDQYEASYKDGQLSPIPAGQFDTERDSLSFQNDIRLHKDHLATLGLDYQIDRIDGSIDYAEDSRSNLGIFGEYQGAFGPVDLNLSLRQDDNEQFGAHNTGSAAIGYRFVNAIQAVLSYGTAFKAPTFNELYYPFFGNPDLKPEESASLELGLNGPLPGSLLAGRWSLSLYQTDIDQMIAFDAYTGAPANIDSARIRGLELGASAMVADWSLSASLTLLDPRNESDGTDDGNLLPRRAREMLNLAADRRFRNWSAGATLFLSGKSYDDLSNDLELDPYALLDLRAEYYFSPSLRLQGRLENALDEDYETAAFYNRPGRAFYMTLRYDL